MKKWDKQIPVMSSAKILMEYRNQLWIEVRDNPNLDDVHVSNIIRTMKNLNERINRRTITPKELEVLAAEVKRLKAHKRVAKKVKRSKRQVKFLIKIKRKRDGKKIKNS